jgi:hypothetical protein
MKSILTFIFSILIFGGVNASTESEFIKSHIIEFHNLNKTVLEFEKHLLNIEQKDTALKYIDNYSLALEGALSVYNKHKKSDNELIAEVSTDLTKMLTDIMNNNYQLLGKLVKSDISKENLKQECKSLVEKNNFISGFLKDASIGICMTTVKDRPKKASDKEQFSKLTQKERDEINDLLVKNYGKQIKSMKKENTATPYEYSCVAIYEFLNMTWKFEKD